jgi:polysaccharide export outer membrane protein
MNLYKRSSGLFSFNVPMVVVTWALLALPVFAQGEEAVSPASGYAVQPGDILEISVWKEEGLQQEVLVTPDGRLSFPLVGNIEAQGQTVQQLSRLVAEKIGKFIPDPAVTVSLKENLGNRIYVIGKVNRPGEFPINRYVDVMQALSMAGGMTAFADRDDIRILRRNGMTQQAIPFDYDEVEEGENLEQNIILKAGDVVVVP